MAGVPSTSLKQPLLQRIPQEYHDAFYSGHSLFLTENYHAQPFRYFLELDFDWELPGTSVLACGCCLG